MEISEGVIRLDLPNSSDDTQCHPLIVKYTKQNWSRKFTYSSKTTVKCSNPRPAGGKLRGGFLFEFRRELLCYKIICN